MQTLGIPALRGAGAARLGTWETIVFRWFSTFPGAPPVIPLAVGGGRGRRQRRDADGGNRKSVCFISFFWLIIENADGGNSQPADGRQKVFYKGFQHHTEL